MRLSNPFHWNRGGDRGFALVSSLALMMLLVVLAVGLLTLSTISMRASAGGGAMAAARANARLAMMLAIGELQKAAGPDQRVTGNADLADAACPNPRWCGVWDTTDESAAPSWLVSGNENRTIDLAAKGDETLARNDRESVAVRSVGLAGRSGLNGRYAWWIGDEGVKARVDLGGGLESGGSDTLRFARARVPQSTGLRNAGDDLRAIADSPDFDKRRIISLPTLAVAGQGAADLPSLYDHDLTTGGGLLPVDVVKGGVKTDLSLVFDSSQKSAGLAASHLGASFSPRNVGGVLIDVASPTRPETFLLAPEISAAAGAGPNWGNLYSYAMLWKQLKGGDSPLIRLNPKNECDIRTSNWAPYRNVDNGGAYKRDVQHTNSPVSPVISHLQIGFRMRAKPGVPYRDAAGRLQPGGYQLQLEMKPLIGLWNPYNVSIRPNQYRIDWALYPYLRLGVNDANGRRLITQQGNVRMWLRELWPPGGDDAVNLQNRWFRLQTPRIDLAPGEIRYFSVQKDAAIDKVNPLVAGWSEGGGFRLDLSVSRYDAVAPFVAGEPAAVPPGSVTWYGDMFLEDTQHDDTLKQFPDGLGKGSSASWVTLKANDADDIHRVSDIWLSTGANSALKSLWRIPEQVISVATATGGAKTSPKIKVEQLAASPWHIATWAWSARTSTGAASGQGSRGWADSNVRYAAANPVWDGSAMRSTGRYDGWYFNSGMIGGSWGSAANPYSKSAVNGDRGPGGRGKVAEGQLGNEEPDAVIEDGRYRGYGGASNTSLTGQTKVVLFDVPRSPLVSLGQFQHAQLSRYGHEPTFAFGASYADPRLPLDGVVRDGLAAIPGYRSVDLSFVLNRALWDGYFFSTLASDHLGGGSLDDRFPWPELSSGRQALPNPRHRFVPRHGDRSLDELVRGAGIQSPFETSARILIEGGFNVNSTSKAAWKAVFSSMEDLEIPVIDPGGRSFRWESPGGVRLPRFGHVLQAKGWSRTSPAGDPSFWTGCRTLTADELDRLAGAMVEEVRARGPFRSMAGFVNRDPGSDRAADRLKGALQAALDRTVNAGLPVEIAQPATQPPGAAFSPVVTNENQACGFAGHLSQGDVLQCLAPVLGVRSDYFRIVTVGRATDPGGRVLATARCEAFVQRGHEMVDPADGSATRTAELRSAANRVFGRRFQIVSFRWLDASGR